jgi:hypothetical protein
VFGLLILFVWLCLICIYGSICGFAFYVLCFEECLDNLRISKSLGYVVAVCSTGLIWWFVIIDFISQGREKKKKKKPELEIVECHDFGTANLEIGPSFLQDTIKTKTKLDS